MCRSAAENGGSPLRCNKHNAFGQQLINLQARKQYSQRRLQETGLTKTQREKLEKVQAETEEAVNVLKQEKADLGYGLTPYTMQLVPECETVLNTLEEAGLRPYIVGGSVRDALLGLPQKDIDIEVYGGDSDKVIKALKKVGNVDEVGKAFGVLKITLGKEDFDVSLPRKDSKVGDGHTGFDVEVDPDLTIEEATARRDFTVNALMYNHKLGFIIDKHDGMSHMEKKNLRHVSEAFDEDPLRVLRGVQMSSRFGFSMHPDTIEKAKTLKGEYSQLARERVQIEFQKLYEKGHHPEEAFKLLKATEWDENLPGLKKANGKKLWKDAARVQKTFNKFNIPVTDRPKILSAVVAKHIDPKYRRDFLTETMVGDTYKNAALNLNNITLPAKTSKKNLHEMAYSLPRNVSIRDWVHYEYASGNKDEALKVYKKAGKLGILDNHEKEKVNGNDIMTMLDRKPGPWMRTVVDKLRTAQYAGEFSTREEGLRYLKKNLKKIVGE